MITHARAPAADANRTGLKGADSLGAKARDRFLYMGGGRSQSWRRLVKNKEGEQRLFVIGELGALGREAFPPRPHVVDHRLIRGYEIRDKGLGAVAQVAPIADDIGVRQVQLPRLRGPASTEEPGASPEGNLEIALAPLGSRERPLYVEASNGSGSWDRTARACSV